MRKVEVVPYQEVWGRMYQEESEKIKAIFGKRLVNVYHIGSTAIPNMSAKPVIDIMVEVNNIAEVDNYNYKMQQLGYQAMGENGIPDRRFFLKGGDNRTHHVHVFVQGHDEITRHLTFRDYMIAHPEETWRYSQLKKQLAKKFPTDINSYIEGKNNYIKEIDKKAGDWNSCRS